MGTLIKNAILVNEGISFRGSLLIEDERITRIFHGDLPGDFDAGHSRIIDAGGSYLIPGVIDDQVHFREPGLTHKGDISTESRAAVAGGITSFMEMPNTIPQTTTQSLLEEKFRLAEEKSAANYSFYMGVTNDNLEEVLKTDPSKVCGIKIFLGSSTGNMLVNNKELLTLLFRNAPAIIAAHCEDEGIIRANTEMAKARFGDQVPPWVHPVIRDAEACYRSSSGAVELAERYGTRLHVIHLSTARETALFQAGNVAGKKITAEVCVHHLWFDDTFYEKLGNRIKWNPAVKSVHDREALWSALLEDRIDVVATDHAPHLMDEKNNTYFKAPSGGPLVQHSLAAMFEMSRQGKITPENIVKKMCHSPAALFRIRERGFLREGYFADLVVVNPREPWTVTTDNLLYKCKWSPFEGTTFSHSVTHTFVNGQLAWHNNSVTEGIRGKRLLFG